MRILGALLAGGKSERFGSDKALALYQGHCLIDHAIALLKKQCDAIVICGRSYKDYVALQDDPENHGPLGGINAALKYAERENFEALISFPCDTIIENIALSDPMQKDVLVKKARAEFADDNHWFEDGCAAYIASQPVIGYWPCSLSTSLDHWLNIQKKRSMKGWAHYCGAKAVDFSEINQSGRFVNVNRPDDLIID